MCAWLLVYRLLPLFLRSVSVCCCCLFVFLTTTQYHPLHPSLLWFIVVSVLFLFLSSFCVGLLSSLLLCVLSSQCFSFSEPSPCFLLPLLSLFAGLRRSCHALRVLIVLLYFPLCFIVFVSFSNRHRSPTSFSLQFSFIGLLSVRASCRHVCLCSFTLRCFLRFGHEYQITCFTLHARHLFVLVFLSRFSFFLASLW